jgi:hypothetical protein
MEANESTQQYREILDRLAELQRDTGNRAGDSKKPDPLPIPLIDPTANVSKLVELQVTRQDDLRSAEVAYLFKVVNLEIKRQDDLRTMQIEYEWKLSDKETHRIDALMLAAKSDISLANEKAALTAANLAAQVVTSAEALRQQVSAFNTSLGDRMAKAEQNLYQMGGATLQSSTNRQQYQWLIGLIVGLTVALVLHFWK